MSFTGSAISPNAPERYCCSSPRNGSRHTTCTSAFTYGIHRFGMSSLEVLLQVHPRIQTRHLVAVPIEHLRRNGPWECARIDTPLMRLRPARMVHARVHVRVEPVLIRCRVVPQCMRLLVREVDLHNRLRVLEAILPRDRKST